MSNYVAASSTLAVLVACALAKPDETVFRSDAVARNPSNQHLSSVSAEFDLDKRRREHWAWQPVQMVAPPRVRDAAWVASPIDQFILRGLEDAGIAPARRAEKRALIRRLYFDLIGLPPAPHEVDAFVANDAPDAIEKVVDRLLASPFFGERWARHWLDLVRYAETRGHEFDHVVPNAFQYRDYVIRALNDDLPYDQFVIEHIAGDLVHRPRRHPTEGFNESVLGTGFWCLGEELHSPVDIRGDETDRIDNKIDVFSKTFLGLTIACARCHDHKFDAISMRDYYALGGFLLSSSYRQVPFQAMQRNQAVARELAALQERLGPEICQAVARATQPAVAHVAAYLSAARAAIQGAATTADKPSGSCGAGVPPAIAAQDLADGTPAPQDLGEVAAALDLDVQRLKHWIEAIESARGDREHPLHLWSLVTYSTRSDDECRSMVRTYWNDCKNRASEIAATWKEVRVIVDFSKPRAGDWSQDGIAFGMRPIRVGDVRFGADPDRPVAEIFHFAAVRSDPSWDVVRLSPGTERDPGKVSWQQAGRTLRTRTISLSGGKLFYLVRGAGHAYAAVDSHRLIAGPLHGALTKSWDSPAAGKLHWVEHDLSSYKGHRVHIEFSPKELDSSKPGETTEVAVLAVVEADQAPCEAISPSVEFARKLAATRADVPNAIAQAYQATLADALDRFGANQIVGSPDAECAAWLASWIIQGPDLIQENTDERSRISEMARCLFEQSASVKARFCSESHAAPALLDGNGVDENLLSRGNHRTPGSPVPRRFLEALSAVEQANGVLPGGSTATDAIQARAGSSFPAIAPAIDRAIGSGRMELAERMTEPTNPLLARVMVNRVWHYLFGRGIVASVDNFGALGETPTHPELLDYLASQFVEQGWSVKRLIRQIVLSSTYQMSAQPLHAASVIDPQNRLLHRMPVRRLEGEVIRDAILSISGRLEVRMFGPSVELSLTPFMEGRGRPDTSGPIDGNGRRSVYLRVRRNFPHPMFMAFDAPTPCTTIGRRSVSNVPAQALTLMNNEFVIAEAKRWARAVAGANAVPAQRAHEMFLTAFARRPTSQELNEVLQFITDQQRRYDGASDADARAWEDLAHVLLNAKEFIFVQ
jgi:hypothetical protein